MLVPSKRRLICAPAAKARRAVGTLDSQANGEYHRVMQRRRIFGAGSRDGETNAGTSPPWHGMQTNR